MSTTLCTCGCGQRVSYTTKQHHLNSQGKMALRARITAENEWLKPSTSQQHQISKKRSHSTSDQNSSRTRRKAAQVGMGGEPEIFHTDADLDPMEPLPEPDPGQAPQTLHAGAAAPGPVPQTFHTDADLAEPLPESAPGHLPQTFHMDADPVEPEPALDHVPDILHTEADPGDLLPDPPNVISMHQPEPNWIADRMRDVIEERWRNSSLQDEGSGGSTDNSSEGEEEVLAVEPALPEAAGETEDDLDNDDDDYTSLFAESDVAGISAWNMLGEDFQREAAAMGLFLLSQPLSNR